MLLHFTASLRSACASSPFRLAVDSEKAAPIACSSAHSFLRYRSRAKLDADRPDLELAFIALEDDAVILMSLGVDDSAQI